jgi:hypothetical protein
MSSQGKRKRDEEILKDSRNIKIISITYQRRAMLGWGFSSFGVAALL